MPPSQRLKKLPPRIDLREVALACLAIDQEPDRYTGQLRFLRSQLGSKKGKTERAARNFIRDYELGGWWVRKRRDYSKTAVRQALHTDTEGTEAIIKARAATKKRGGWFCELTHNGRALLIRYQQIPSPEGLPSTFTGLTGPNPEGGNFKNPLRLPLNRDEQAPTKRGGRSGPGPPGNLPPQPSAPPEGPLMDRFRLDRVTLSYPVTSGPDELPGGWAADPDWGTGGGRLIYTEPEAYRIEVVGSFAVISPEAVTSPTGDRAQVLGVIASRVSGALKVLRASGFEVATEAVKVLSDNVASNPWARSLMAAMPPGFQEVAYTLDGQRVEFNRSDFGGEFEVRKRHEEGKPDRPGVLDDLLSLREQVALIREAMADLVAVERLRLEADTERLKGDLRARTAALSENPK